MENSESQLGEKTEEAVKGMERIQEESRMFKAAKMLNRKRFENPYVHDKNGKHVSNSEEVYKIMKDHFKCNFYKESIIHCPHLLGSTKTSINELQHKK